MPSENENFGQSVTSQLKLFNNGMKKLNDRMENLDKKMKFCMVSLIAIDLRND
jgi:hypothetical protein